MDLPESAERPVPEVHERDLDGEVADLCKPGIDPSAVVHGP
jgi:hypothetical protein